MKKTVLLLSLCDIVLTLLPGPAGTGEKKARLANKYEQCLNVESVDVLNFLGSVYLEDGRRDKAREAFAKSLKIKSDQPLVTSIIERIDN